MEIQDGQAVNLYELVQQLIAAASAHDEAEVERLNNDVGAWFSRLYDELLWYRGWKQGLDGFFAHARADGKPNVLKIPTADPKRSELYLVEMKGYEVDND
jgi:hypothetical protein